MISSMSDWEKQMTLCLSMMPATASVVAAMMTSDRERPSSAAAFSQAYLHAAAP
jgi:hypothetical protein